MKPLLMRLDVSAIARESLATDLSPSRTPRAAARWPFGPSLTAAAPAAGGKRGQDGKTALQPNRKTADRAGDRRTDHALQKADIFTCHRQHRFAFS
jgi:hypothetical protein